MSGGHTTSGSAGKSPTAAAVTEGAGPAYGTKPIVREAIMALSDSDLVARFRVGLENFDMRTTELNDEQLDCAFLVEAQVGRWPCRVLLGHLADAELAFVHRMRRVFAEDGPVFSMWDENAFIDREAYGSPKTGSKYPIGGFLATIYTLRQWTGEWLTTLKKEDFQRKGMHPERGEQTLRTILEYDVWHLEHHAWYLNRKVAKMLGPSAP